MSQGIYIMNDIVPALKALSYDMQYREGLTVDLDFTNALTDTYHLLDQWLRMWKADSITCNDLTKYCRNQIERYGWLIENEAYSPLGDQWPYSSEYIQRRIALLNEILTITEREGQ